MIRFALLIGLVACGRAQGVTDEQLAGLVTSPPPPAKIDVAAAASDPVEFARAMASTHGQVVAAIGPNAFTIDTKTVVEEGGKSTSELSDHTLLEMGDGGAFHGSYANSDDYGREAIWLKDKLYLRPRYQRWNARAPETPDEPAQIRDTYFAAIAATWDLLAPGVELVDHGTVTVAGRPAKRIEVKLSPSPRDNPHETVIQRRWRESRNVEAVAGEVALDIESGVPLSAKLTGQIAFSREGRRFTMKMALEGAVTSIGKTDITPPPDGEIVATPERSREVDERDSLPGGIA